MKNTIFFVTGLDSGGLENYLLRFLEHKSTRFDDIIVFCKNGKEGQLRKKIEKLDNVSVVSKSISFFNIIDYIFLFRFFKKKQKFSVCDFTGNFAGLVLFCAMLAGVKKRIAFYRGATNHFKESKIKLIYNQIVWYLTFKFATNILSNSKAAFDFFYPNVWKNDNRFNVIYNGINYNNFISETENIRSELNIPENAFVVGHTGRYNYAKNHDTILNVAERLCKSDENIYFVLCGNGVKENLEQKVIDLNLQKCIILLNIRNDIPKVLNTIDCFYFPSLTEGQPNSLIEAMLMNLPFVASDIEPIKETIPAGYLSQLIPATNIKLACQKIKNIQNKNNIEKFGNLRNWVIKNYNPDKLFTQFYDVL